MQQETFFTFAVGAGFLLIGLVVYSYLRPKPEHRPAVTALLGLLGFALVASPNWTRISIRSEGLELSLLREIEGRQLRALTSLQERLERAEPVSAGLRPLEPADGAASAADSGEVPSAATHGAGDEGRDAATDDAPDDAARQDVPTVEPDRSRRVGRRALAQDPAIAEGWIEAYRRGTLDLTALSNAELLALSEHLSTDRRWVSRHP